MPARHSEHSRGCRHAWHHQASLPRLVVHACMHGGMRECTRRPSPKVRESLHVFDPASQLTSAPSPPVITAPPLHTHLCLPALFVAESSHRPTLVCAYARLPLHPVMRLLFVVRLAQRGSAFCAGLPMLPQPCSSCASQLACLSVVPLQYRRHRHYCLRQLVVALYSYPSVPRLLF